MSQNSYWIQNYMIAKKTVPPVATVTGNLPFYFPFLRVVWNASVAVGRSRKPQSNPDPPPIEISWQNSHRLQ